MAETLLITGVSGFVGSHLARFCVENSDQRVVGLLRSDSDRELLEGISRSIDTVTADVRDRSRLEDVLSDVEPSHVCHLAALSHVPRSLEKPRKTYQVNFKGTLNLLEALESAGSTPSVLLAGSASEYGRTSRGADMLCEDDPLRPTTPYGVSKVAMETLGGQWAYQEGWRILTTRAFPHTGPGQRPSFVCSDLTRQIARVEAGNRDGVSMGNLSVVRDFLDVRDVVRAYYRLLTNTDVESGSYNVCSGEGTALEEIVSMARELSPASFFVESETERQRSKEVDRVVGDPSKLRRTVDWSPELDLEQTLEDLLQYWREKI